MTNWGVALSLLLGLQARALNHCPSVKEAAEIQIHFQLLQHAATWIPGNQEKELKRIFSVNDSVLREFSCYFTKGDDPGVLNDVLSALKLQILNLRYVAYQKNYQAVSQALLSLRKMSGSYLGQSSLMARRLGASVRSLLLDELERLIDLYPDLVRDEVRLGIWRSDLTVGIELEILTQWEDLKAQWKKKTAPAALARHFGARGWRASEEQRSALDKIVAHFKRDTKDSLESQLLVLFRANPKNVDLQLTENVIRHYLSLSLAEVRKNNYFLLKPWLDPIIEEKVRALKSELGVSHSLIFPLAGVDIEGPFAEITQPIQLLSSKMLNLAKANYARVANPIGRLYEIVFLKRMTQMWSQIDIAQLRSDLNRVSFLRTLLAVQDYQKRFSRWPASVEDLVTRKMIQEVPKDYFTGKKLQYDSQRRQIWSVGENGIDENGHGDDISLSLSL